MQTQSQSAFVSNPKYIQPILPQTPITPIVSPLHTTPIPTLTNISSPNTYQISGPVVIPPKPQSTTQQLQISEHESSDDKKNLAPDGYKWRKYGQKTVKGNSRVYVCWDSQH